MQTELELNLLTPGRIFLLLLVDARPAANRLAWTSVRFDGGRRQDAQSWRGLWSAPDPEALTRLRALLRQVFAPPRLLFLWGGGRRTFLESLLATAERDRLRIVDLPETAADLFSLPGNAPLENVLAAAGLTVTIRDQETAGLPDEAVEELLWATLAAAGRRGVTEAALPDHAARSREERRSFNHLGPLSARDCPAGPAVYEMLDRRGGVLYVGKAANLARRLDAYFRHAWNPHPKLQALRRELADIAVHPAGSELEALLLEQRLITERRPRLNIQRELEVAEAPAAYGGHRAVILIEPSVKNGHADLFLLGPEPPLWQCAANLSRWPSRTIQALCRAALDPAAAPRPASRTLHAWDAAAHTLAWRYFRQHRARLRWAGLDETALADPARLQAELRTLAARALAEPEPADFRLMAGSAAPE